MKNVLFYAVITLLLAPATLTAQIPETYVDGHIVTDIDGNTHDLDFILGSGKALAIDMFWDVCGPCWSFHESGVMEEIHEHLPYVEVLGLEGVEATPESAITNPDSGYGDWSLGGTIPFALANDDEISANLNSSSYPTLVVVCPNKKIVEMYSSQTFEDWKNVILNCEGLVTSVEETDAISVTDIFPNPANETANIFFNANEAGIAAVEIINTVGQVVASKHLGQVSGAQNIALSTSDVESGIYIVKITLGENITTRSLSVTK